MKCDRCNSLEVKLAAALRNYDTAARAYSDLLVNAAREGQRAERLEAALREIRHIAVTRDGPIRTASLLIIDRALAGTPPPAHGLTPQERLEQERDR